MAVTVAVDLWWEVWPRPGSATFEPIVLDVPFESSSYHDGLGQVGDGTLSIPEDFDTSLLADPSVPSGSLLRLMSEGGMVGEWLFTQTTPPTDPTDVTVDFQGVGPNSMLAYARLEPYDWDGSDDFTPSFPDWVWGGRNVVGNPGFEDNLNTPTIYNLVIDASAGTYTLSDGVDTTSAIAFNANAVAVENALESDIGAITDALVSGSGDADDPFVIELVTPPFGVNLTVDGSGLTGTASMNTTQEGGLDSFPWTRSQTVSRGIPDIFGEGTMEVSTTQAHSGTYSLLLAPDTLNTTTFGTQQVVRVEPGGTYQAAAWVYPTDAGSRFRFVIRTVSEGLIASGPWIDSLTANTWNQVTIPDVIIPAGVTEVVVRLAILPDGTQAPFYVDDFAVEEGLAPTTVGEILRLIYEDATSDHAGRVVWEDQANPPNPYLVLGFTDSLDSHGNSWDRADLRIRLPMRMNYSQVMAELARQFGYEYEVRYSGGVWEWNVYNPGTLGTDRSASVSLIAGTTEIRRRVPSRLPVSTNTMVEGSNRVTARAADAGLIAALGRIEGSVYMPDAEDVPAAAAETLARGMVTTESYQLTISHPDLVPGIDYRVGDLVRVLDPPIDQTMRVIDILLALTAGRQEWVVQLGSVMLDGATAVASAVGSLLPASPIHRPDGAFERATPSPVLSPPLLLGGGGGAPTLVVAASNATQSSKDKADFVCTGTDDQDTINQAVAAMPEGGRLLLTEGTFDISAFIDGTLAGGPVHLQGMGPGTIITGSTTDRLVLGFASVSNLGLAQSGTGVALTLSDNAKAEQIVASSAGYAAVEMGRSLLVDSDLVNTGGNPCIEWSIDSSTAAGQAGLRNVTCEDGGVNLFHEPSSATGIPQAFIHGLAVFRRPEGSAAYGLRIETTDTNPSDLALEIHGLTVDRTTQGLQVIETHGITANGIYINGTGQHGLYVEDSDLCHFQGVVMDSGRTTDDTYDQVHVTGTSARNRFSLTTQFRLTGGNEPRYNLFFDTNTVDNIESSDLRSTAGTAAYLDSGSNDTTDEHFV